MSMSKYTINKEKEIKILEIAINKLITYSGRESDIVLKMKQLLRQKNNELISTIENIDGVWED